MSSSSSVQSVTHANAVTELAVVQQGCNNIVQYQRNILLSTYSELLRGIRYVAIIGFPAHENKGDSWIWVAEDILMAQLGIRIIYVCTRVSYNRDELAALATGNPDFAIILHGGGNLGDLYKSEMTVRLQVLHDFPNVPLRFFPQSIHYRDKANMAPLLEAFEAARDVELVVRDKASFDFATEHFVPYGVGVHLTPDIVFAVGPRPDIRERITPSSDLLVFKRKDQEATPWKWLPQDPAGFFAEFSAQNSVSFHLDDWLTIPSNLASTKIKVPHTAHTHVAWKRAMAGAEWLASGRVGVVDRLHGHIVSILLGIPHILVDNKIGKLGDYYHTWTQNCSLGAWMDEQNGSNLASLIEGHLALLK